ncbi:hypothetical protein SPRG_07445 [Saprolegnia parasitica CBS 223.65]|uniref:Myb-like domain-containing protein n=1 Tax=Saprolegnia parasitica (strain CBS 223.65) TaxID=695850 RepID=A0A067CKY9_SAPPC|nr:hypothetical protein SPRG_07445 [Saprolegnia parasitica CBS 223.65]KDO27196.1 hypothetical protein SPRG_07445 [Saprolegnia parasitica CBS 223.65]|eukprot:XP_012201974.1 hypothetical protein SPRG_07445 [Saprolegnia parasitica CBS 223.65]
MSTTPASWQRVLAELPPADAPRDSERPWTAEEHTRFIDGLELYGAAASPPWALIAACVGSRSESETKEHGEFYLHALLTQSLLEANQPRVWSDEENAIFEAALANEPNNGSPSWTKIALALPGKTVYDVMDHYERLVRDLTAIEKGIEMTTSSVESDLRVANMQLIASIASAKNHSDLLQLFRDAHENACPVEVATCLATAVVAMVASDDSVTKGLVKLTMDAAPTTKRGAKGKPPLAHKKAKATSTLKHGSC